MDTMFPRYKEGDILSCNPETKPQVGDEIVTEIKQVTQKICIVREIVHVQPTIIALASERAATA